MSDITRLLRAVERGEAGSADELMRVVYAELRRIAAHKMAREQPGQTLQTTALVHEAWLRLGGDHSSRWENRAHFFAAAAEAMRRILVDNARRKRRLKHGGDLERVELDHAQLAVPLRDDDVLAVDEALDLLEQNDPRAARMIHLCFFLGMTQQEAADTMGISVSTAERTWAYARAWLYRRIRDDR